MQRMAAPWVSRRSGEQKTMWLVPPMSFSALVHLTFRDTRGAFQEAVEVELQFGRLVRVVSIICPGLSEVDIHNIWR